MNSPNLTADRFTAVLGSRELFPDLKAAVYVNHAAISPPSLAVRAEIVRALGDFGREGTGAFSEWMRHRKDTKEGIANLLGAQADDLALVPNTTTGIGAIAMCFPWRSGDTIIVFKGEFPTNVTPWQQAAKAFDLKIKFLELEPIANRGGADFGPLETALQEGARLVAISAVQFQTGLRVPLKEVSQRCQRYDTQLCVDGIQAAGVVPIDLHGIDYMAVGGHKWLMGPEGAGLLYVAPGRANALRKNLSGWLSHTDPLSFLFDGPDLLRYDRPIRQSTDFLEGGSQNTIGYAGLGAAVGLLNQLGTHAIFEHVQTWHNALEPGLLERGFVSLRAPDIDRRSGILSVLPPRRADLISLYKHLEMMGISCTIPDGHLRFAPHWPNHVDETAQILEAIDAYDAMR